MLVALTMLTLTGCSSLDGRRAGAAAALGQTRAGVRLPELPEDCRQREPHAVIFAGMEARSVIRRERAATNRANDRVERCARFYDVTKGKLQ